MCVGGGEGGGVSGGDGGSGKCNLTKRVQGLTFNINNK